MAERETDARSARSTSSTRSASSTPGKHSKHSPAAAEVLRSARESIEELTGMESETVSSVVRGEDGGWTLHVEVVELRRVPDSASLLGSYEITLDEEGRLTGYHRRHRYERGKPDPR